MTSMKPQDVIKDGRKYSVNEDNGRDHHLDFDMFDYIYSLVSTVDGYSTVLSPLSHPLKKFDSPKANKKAKTAPKKFDVLSGVYVLEDPDLNQTSMEHPRVSGNGTNTITILSDDRADFNDMIEICNLYGFKFHGPISRQGIGYYWEWRMDVQVPMCSAHVPMMLEDYFESINVPLEKVMPSSWLKSYRSKLKKLNEEAEAHLNQVKFDRIYKSAVTHAWQRGDIPLDKHLTDLLLALEAENVTYKKTVVKAKFMNEFADDEDDETSAVVTSLFEEQPAT